MEKELKGTVKTKRVFEKITTVTVFQIFEVTHDDRLKPIVGENGEPIKFDKRAAAENYCAEHDLNYMEIKHIFYM